MSRSESSPSQGIAPDGRTVLYGGVGGLLSYLIGYALTYAVTGQQIANSFAARILEIATGDFGTWKLVGWVFFNAHFVTTEIPGLFGSSAVNLVGRGDTFPSWLFLVPPVLLVLAGALVAVASRSDDLLSGAVGGATAVVAYLPLSVVGAFLFAISVGDTDAGPTLVTAILLAGIVYPLVFGGVGGALGSFASGE
ncbi:transporter [Halobellus rubicundus]|uniref:Transporter n=1 Tax=Halobellus rubicundus TaxID=2996466 RepID=A0ABD5MLW2_9EURY